MTAMCVTHHWDRRTEFEKDTSHLGRKRIEGVKDEDKIGLMLYHSIHDPLVPPQHPSKAGLPRPIGIRLDIGQRAN